MNSIIKRESIPVARRQLLSEPAKLAVSVLAIAAAVALVLLLTGLRRGIGEQATLYLDRQPPVLVGQAGTRNFMAQTSVLPEALGDRLESVPGVAEATPISQQFAMLTLHGRRVLPLLVGFDPGRPGGPWSLAAGRTPRTSGELVLDRLVPRHPASNRRPLARHDGVDGPARLRHSGDAERSQPSAAHGELLSCRHGGRGLCDWARRANRARSPRRGGADHGGSGCERPEALHGRFRRDPALDGGDRLRSRNPRHRPHRLHVDE